tara:strand:+ start:21983 stop:23155 length:1173 start_codon:yes stop_codon:yes gene_type:complete
MTTFSFSLLTGENGPLVTLNAPETFSIPTPTHKSIVSEGDEVLADEKIAEATRPGVGDVHSPAAGKIEDITVDAIVVCRSGTGQNTPDSAPPSGGKALREWLRGLGINTYQLVRASQLIINAVPPEPGISIYEPLIQDYRHIVELGLDAVQRIVNPSKLHLVVAKGNRTNAFPNCSILQVPPVYPNGIDQLVIKATTGEETLLGTRPKDATILSIRDLYYIGKVMETKRPLTETIMTIGKDNLLIKIGTQIRHLAQEAGVTVQPGDRVIFGGLMRGVAALNIDQGVDKYTTGMIILRHDEGLSPTDNFCLGCGECERHCPARIMPGLISRCAEFKHFERAEDYHIHSCIECGICGYWCKAQRPLLQYIKLAKYEIALLRTASSTLEGEGQ